MRCGLLFVAMMGSLALPLAGCEKSPSGPTPSPEIHVPIWEQPIPPGTEEVTDGTAKINVVHRREENGQQNLLVFDISEEHGYMVDGIRLGFWYRSKNDQGEWVDDGRVIDFFVKDRLDLNGTLTVSTPLIPLEFEHLGIDIAQTTTENWGVRINGYTRAMKKAQ